MKKYLPFIIIGILILSGGAYFLSTTERGSNSLEHNGHKGEAGNKSVAQSHRSYGIDIIKKPAANEIRLHAPATIKYRIKNDKGEIVKDFAIAHEKIMHFIIVRDDLTQFQHLHPSFNKDTGEFSVDVTYKVDGKYRFFADFTPGSDNPMKLPVAVNSDLDVGNVSNVQPIAVVVDTSNEKTMQSDYQVTYLLPTGLKKQASTNYSLTVKKNSQQITLEKYLGALGHSVILKEGTLDYIHTHAGEAGEVSGQMEHDEHGANKEQSPNTINFTTTFPEAGIYKIFTQFQHQGKVFTTDYTVEVN